MTHSQFLQNSQHEQRVVWLCPLRSKLRPHTDLGVENTPVRLPKRAVRQRYRQNSNATFRLLLLRYAASMAQWKPYFVDPSYRETFPTFISGVQSSVGCPCVQASKESICAFSVLPCEVRSVRKWLPSFYRPFQAQIQVLGWVHDDMSFEGRLINQSFEGKLPQSCDLVRLVRQIPKLKSAEASPAQTKVQGTAEVVHRIITVFAV